MLNEKKTPELPDDETLITCLVEKCLHNDKQGACRTDGGMIMIEVGLDGRPCCEEFELDPHWIEATPAIKC